MVQLRYPSALFRPLPENRTQPLLAAKQVILHSAVSTASSMHGYFSSPGVNVESHFYVAEDGETEQYMETNRQADANYRANTTAISIETWDRGDPDRVPWTAAQCARLVDLLVWCGIQHNIPMRTVSAPTEPGVGYHSQYNGLWTPAVKTCPGVARIPQVTLLIERAAAIMNGIYPVIVLPRPPVPKAPEGAYRLAVDGVFGPRTVMRLQQSLNRTLGGTDLRVDGSFGDLTQRRLQQRLGVRADGIVGPATIRALQRSIHAFVDGSWGPETTRTLQGVLNTREL